jgi:hypothetical protein
MKQLFVFMCIYFSDFYYSQNPGVNVFSGVNFFLYKINFSQPNYWDTLTIITNLEQKNIFLMIFILMVYHIKLRVSIKGNSSFNHPNNKNHLKFASDNIVIIQRWVGMKSVHLNNYMVIPLL